MGTASHAADPVTFAGGTLDKYRHVCAFVNGRDTSESVFDSFVRQALDGGDRLIYIVDPVDTAVPVNRLRHLGYDAGGLLEHHRCEVRTWADTYLRGGEFNEATMLNLLDELLVKQPSPRVRLTCDMGWAAGRADLADEIIDFEAKANFIHADHPHIVICRYDTSLFDGSFVIDILRTHPMVLVGGMLQENPFFVPPDEFLSARSTRTAS
ncbi:MAG: hypothetical protein K0R99_4645 [Microbacterium sp.]|jgi:hypothetical protein|uniref:MEDS domain-containing protein n=1 Tax=Microbacterium sp. TaxID=51671 RepID=UPI002620B719|nr:MEDS domain-containing protein [Microbacterium sp.]MDF2563199.1 hypothetical protein [Microbacterium sp.]